jgi:hypothetical protein
MTTVAIKAVESERARGTCAGVGQGDDRMEEVYHQVVSQAEHGEHDWEQEACRPDQRHQKPSQPPRQHGRARAPCQDACPPSRGRNVSGIKVLQADEENAPRAFSSRANVLNGHDVSRLLHARVCVVHVCVHLCVLPLHPAPRHSHSDCHGAATAEGCQTPTRNRYARRTYQTPPTHQG